MLQRKAVDPETLSLLKELMALPELSDFYLVGGTALALQIGHRKSIDLDLFCDSAVAFDQDTIIQVMPQPFTEFARSEVFLGIHIREVKCDFVKYPFPRIDPLVIREEVRMASMIEIAAMKLWAITRRGSKKDFIDLYFLLKRYSLKEMFDFFRKKFPSVESLMVIRSLTWFEDAEEDLDPVMMDTTSWETIKSGIRETVNSFMSNPDN
jgi:hypothetical protein